MAKKKDTVEDLEPLGPEDPTEEAAGTPVEDLKQAEVEFGTGNIGIEDMGGNVTYTTVPDGEAKERRLLLNGVNVEHCREDASGRWIYRRM